MLLKKIITLLALISIAGLSHATINGKIIRFSKPDVAVVETEEGKVISVKLLDAWAFKDDTLIGLDGGNGKPLKIDGSIYANDLITKVLSNQYKNVKVLIEAERWIDEDACIALLINASRSFIKDNWSTCKLTNRSIGLSLIYSSQTDTFSLVALNYQLMNLLEGLNDGYSLRGRYSDEMSQEVVKEVLKRIDALDKLLQSRNPYYNKDFAAD